MPLVTSSLPGAILQRADLRTQWDQVVEAIAGKNSGISRMAGGKRRGRPWKWMTEVKLRGRRKGSKNEAE
jgi:hypothetical protein